MLLARTLRRVCRPAVRFYGFEEPGDKTGPGFYHFADSLNHSDRKTPEEQGFSISGGERELDRAWERGRHATAINVQNQGGVNALKIVESELESNNPLGDYDNSDTRMAKHEVKTRIIHVLRHFEKINLKKLDWDAHFEEGLLLDSLERVALLTSIETEFSTVFEDNVFDHLQTLNHVVKQITTDHSVF